MNCNVCKSENLIEGAILDAAGSAGVYIFTPNDKPFYKRMLGIGGRQTRSFACVHCGNLQFVIDFNDEDRKQYLKFDGAPPTSVTNLSDEENS